MLNINRFDSNSTLDSSIPFSLRYLQFESRSLATLTNLDPIQTSVASAGAVLTPNNGTTISGPQKNLLRTASEDNSDSLAVAATAAASSVVAGKLSTMLTPPLCTGSVDNCEQRKEDVNL